MAESVFGKPIDTAVKELSDKIGTVPSGKTVEGQIDALYSNLNSFLTWTNELYTNTDTTNGFVDTGISTSDYFILGAFTPNAANSVVRISNLTGSSPNYRVQIVSPINGTVDKSNWSIRIAFCLVARSKVS